jgi:hypothetical protein
MVRCLNDPIFGVRGCWLLAVGYDVYNIPVLCDNYLLTVVSCLYIISGYIYKTWEGGRGARGCAIG